MPAHRTQNSRHLRVEAAPAVGAPPINIISPTPRAFIFPSTEANNSNLEDSSYPFVPHLHTSHSLPNLFAFDSNQGADSSWTDAQSSTGSQTSMFSLHTDSPSSFSGSSFASPADSLYGSHASSPPDSSSTPPLSLSPSPPPLLYSSTDGDLQQRSSSPAPYPHPLPPHSNGQVRTQPPRPPNPWICFRNVRSAQYKSTGEFPKLDRKGRGCSAPSSPTAGPIGLDGEARRPRQADLSKHISLEWKALTDEEKAPYVRMSEEAKIVHARVYPGYKYQPRRKLDGTDSAKKSAKAKKSSRKSSRNTRKTSLTVEIDDQTRTADADTGGVAIKLPVLDLEVAPQGQDVNGGEQSKEWTWLPDQTLLPFAWDIDQDQSALIEDVMHPLDANVDERGESTEDLFQEPFYLSFPPLDVTSETIPSFFSFPESEADATSFMDSNLDFPTPSALGLQDGVFEHQQDVSQPSDGVVENPFVSCLRRDSLANPYPVIPSENVGGDGEFVQVPESDDHESQPRSFVQDKFTSLPHFSSRPRTARRGSVPTYSHFTSPDGLLQPPYISQTHSHGRSRRSSVPTLTSTSSDVRGHGHDMRSIPTNNFSASSGITTSILIPTAPPPFDMELQRDLEDYSLAVGSMGLQSPATKGFPPAPPVPADANAGMEAQNSHGSGLTEFDFEAEFGDIIDIRGRPA